MQCPECNSTIEVESGKATPTVCPSCSASLNPPSKRRRSGALVLILSLLLVVLATVAVGSTVVALRMIERREKAEHDFAAATKVYDQVVASVSGASQLKGANMAPAREAVLQPILQFCTDYLQAHPPSEVATLPQQAAAQLRATAIEVKLGKQDAVHSFGNGVYLMREMEKNNFPPGVYPSISQSLLNIVSTTEWLSLRGSGGSPGGGGGLGGGGGFGANMTGGLGLLFSVHGCIEVLDLVLAKHPDALGLREDLAVVLKTSAAMRGLIRAGISGDEMTQLLLEEWQRARDTNEILLKAKPNDATYKAQLAESLIGMGKMQKALKENDQAIASYKRGVELREELAAANPDDDKLKQELNVAKRELERLAPAPPKDAAEAPPASTSETPPATASE